MLSVDCISESLSRRALLRAAASVVLAVARDRGAGSICPYDLCGFPGRKRFALKAPSARPSMPLNSGIDVPTAALLASSQPQSERQERIGLRLPRHSLTVARWMRIARPSRRLQPRQFLAPDCFAAGEAVADALRPLRSKLCLTVSSRDHSNSAKRTDPFGHPVPGTADLRGAGSRRG